MTMIQPSAFTTLPEPRGAVEGIAVAEALKAGIGRDPAIERILVVVPVVAAADTRAAPELFRPVFELGTVNFVIVFFRPDSIRKKTIMMSTCCYWNATRKKACIPNSHSQLTSIPDSKNLQRRVLVWGLS